MRVDFAKDLLSNLAGLPLEEPKTLLPSSYGILVLGRATLTGTDIDRLGVTDQPSCGRIGSIGRCDGGRRVLWVPVHVC